jgi:serine/threonine-protein kinase
MTQQYFERLALALRRRYTLVRRLGQGGMGVVYLARDLKLRRSVAIKVLLPEVRAALGSERFEREVELVSALSHPYIVKLFAAEKADGVPFYVMDFVEGESLQHRLEREGPIPLKDALKIASDVGEALQYAHEHGVIHRDIKPGNILLAGGHALLTDFGIAKSTTNAGTTLTTEGAALGTAPYMSPEQAGGEKRVDARSDVYGLAAVLYEMLVGEPPFTGKTYQAIVARVMVDPPRPLRTTRSSVPARVEHAILEALAKTPADRPASVREFLDRLGNGSLAETRSVARGRVIAAIGAGVAAVMVGAWLIWQAERAAPTNNIAVLYFESLSPDTADTYLSDGLTEQVIERLGQVPRLGVLSRSAVRRYRGVGIDPRAAARSLAASHIVTGTLRRGGARLRVTVELAQSSDGRLLWGQLYERADSDFFAIEEDIARSVASAVVGRLVPTERGSWDRRPTANAHAYDHFLRGNYAIAHRTPTALGLAIEEYGAAVRLDSTFTTAVAWLAVAYGMFVERGWSYPGLSQEQLFARARDLAARALRLDASNSDAWLAMAEVLSYRYTLDSAIAAYREAIRLNPRNAQAIHSYGLMLEVLGDEAGAIAAYRDALRVDAARSVTLLNLARISFSRRDYATALALCDSALNIDAGFVDAYGVKSRVLLQLNRFEDVARALEATARITGAPPGFGVLLLQSRMRDTVGVRARLASLTLALERHGAPNADNLMPALISLALGDSLSAIGFLERVRPRHWFLARQLRAPEFDPIRHHPRFERIVEEAHAR